MGNLYGGSGPSHPRFGRFVQRLAEPLFRRRFASYGMHGRLGPLALGRSCGGFRNVSRWRRRAMSSAWGSPGITPGFRWSSWRCRERAGIVLLISNDEEERFTGTEALRPTTPSGRSGSSRLMARGPRALRRGRRSALDHQLGLFVLPPMALRGLCEELPWSWKLCRKGSIRTGTSWSGL